MTARIILLPAALICACGIERHSTPLPSSAMVTVANPLGLQFAHPLRCTLVWTTTELLPTTPDLPIDPEMTDAAVALVPISADEESLVTPVESLTLTSQKSLPVYRPRLVVYQDIDESASFDPVAPLGSGSDVVVAVDEGSGVAVGAILGLAHELNQLSLEETEAYYQMTGGFFTPFVFTTNGSSGLDPTLPSAVLPITLRLSDSEVPQEQLRCGRGRVLVYGDGTGATRNIDAIVSSTLDAAQVCGVDMPNCTSQDLAGLPPPDPPTRTDKFMRVIQCRQNERLQTLIVQEAPRTCESCVCPMTPHATVYFADAAGVPSWWPCGAAIPFCVSPLPLYYMDTTCP